MKSLYGGVFRTMCEATLHNFYVYRYLLDYCCVCRWKISVNLAKLSGEINYDFLGLSKII